MSLILGCPLIARMSAVSCEKIFKHGRLEGRRTTAKRRLLKGDRKKIGGGPTLTNTCVYTKRMCHQIRRENKLEALVAGNVQFTDFFFLLLLLPAGRLKVLHAFLACPSLMSQSVTTFLRLFLFSELFFSLIISPFHNERERSDAR